MYLFRILLCFDYVTFFLQPVARKETRVALAACLALSDCNLERENLLRTVKAKRENKLQMVMEVDENMKNKVEEKYVNAPFAKKNIRKKNGEKNEDDKKKKRKKNCQD